MLEPAGGSQAFHGWPEAYWVDRSDDTTATRDKSMGEPILQKVNLILAQ